MARSKKRVTQKGTEKAVGLVPVTVRIPTDLWEKVGWEAEYQGLNRQQLVRNTLTHATRGTKAPKPLDSREIAASPAEWQAWKDAAAEHGVTLDKLIAGLMQRVVAQTFPPKGGEDS